MGTDLIRCEKKRREKMKETERSMERMTNIALKREWQKREKVEDKLSVKPAKETWSPVSFLEHCRGETRKMLNH